MLKNMKKRVFKSIVVSFLVLFLINMGFAYGSSTSFSSNNSNIKVSLQIDYGNTITQFETVTLSLDIGDKSLDSNNIKVEFSLDKENWRGFNTNSRRWIGGHKGDFQPFYSDFNIGNVGGNKTIYVRVSDNKGNIGVTSSNILYSPNKLNPSIENTISISDYSSENLSGDEIGNGSGTRENPYLITKNSTRVMLKTINSHEVSYSFNGEGWSDWSQINSNKIDLPINFIGQEGLKNLYVKTRNQFGIESEVLCIYYLLDTSNPIIEVRTKYHDLIAVDGGITFDVEFYDRLSNYIDFTIEIFVNDKVIFKNGRVGIYVEGKATASEIVIQGLPEGNFRGVIKAKDEAGNSTSRNITIYSVR